MKKGILIGFILAISFSVLAWRTSDSFIKIGSSGDITIFLGSIGKIKFNAANNRLEFSNDGTNFKALGAGGGGGGGQNFFQTNPDADSGLNGWTNIGGGSFAINQTLPINGDNDFSWDASAQNDILRTEAIVIPEFFKGKACQIQFRFTGSSSDLVEPQVVDTSFNIISTALFRNQLNPPTSFLQVQTGIVQRAIYFVCPLSGDIHFQFNQTQAGNPAVMRFDDAHIGENLGLVQSTSPDQLSARFDTVSSGTKITENIPGWIDFSRNGTGDMTHVFQAGRFTVIPSCQIEIRGANAANDDVCGAGDSASLSGIRVQCRQGSGTLIDAQYDLECTKQGIDAQKQRQFFIQVPRISAHFNKLSIRIGSACALGADGQNWVDSCNNTPTGQYDLTPITDTYTVTPSCQCTIESTGTGKECVFDHVNSSTTNLRFFTRTSAGGAEDNAFGVSCDRQGTDVRFATAFLVFIKQVVTSFFFGVATESCIIENSAGTPIVGSNLCNGWVDGFTDTALGRWVLNITSGTYIGDPVCTLTGSGVNNCSAHESPTTNSAVTIRNFTCSDGVVVDHSVHVKCIGARP